MISEVRGSQIDRYKEQVFPGFWGGECHRDSVVGLVSKITTGGDKRPTGLSRTWDLLAGDCHSSLSLTANKYRTHSQAEQGWVGLRCFHVNVE